MSSPWQEARAADGKIYYYNAQTKATQWTKPAEMMTPAERALQDLPWKEHKAQDGRPYWYHAQTRETTWQMPDEYRQALDRAQQQTPSHGMPGGLPAPTFVAGGTQHFGRMPENNDRQLTIAGQFNDAGGDSAARSNMSLGASTFATDKDEPQYSTQDEAETAFIKLLRRNGVQADWTWEKTMRSIIKEPQYRALKDPKDRKAAFERYIVELKQQEQEKAKDRIAKLRQDFSVMLKSHPEIKYYTRWKTARPIIEGETIFRSTSDEDERRQLFDEYIMELRKSEQEREARMRREAIDDLVGILKSLDLEPYTRWSEAQTVIEQNERFQSEERFQALSKLDILNAFENHIKFLERTFNDQRQKTKTLKYRKERKNREAFAALLNELRDKGEIRAGAKWKFVYPLIKDDERYLNMLGQPGSTPLDMFWDIAEDIEREVRLKRNLVMDVLEERRFEIKETTTVKEFADVLNSDSRTSHYDSETIAVLFDKMREKIVRRIEDDRHQQERHQRRRIDALRSAIKHLEPPIEATDIWEKVRPRIEKLEEFRALDSEELRRTAFDKHIRRLKDKQDERDKERERRDRDHREKDRTHRRRDESRNGHEPFHKSSSSRHHRERSRHLTRSPEPDAYEAERRRAAGERERQYSHRGERSDRHRDRDSSLHRSQRSDRSARAESRHRHERQESVYDRERREREEERERQYRSRGDDVAPLRDEYRPARRRRGMTPDDSDRDIKRSRRERTPRARSPPPRRDTLIRDSPPIDYGKDVVAVDYGNDPFSSDKPAPVKTKAAKKEGNKDKSDKMDVDVKAEESEEGEIAE